MLFNSEAPLPFVRLCSLCSAFAVAPGHSSPAKSPVSKPHVVNRRTGAGPSQRVSSSVAKQRVTSLAPLSLLAFVVHLRCVVCELRCLGSPHRCFLAADDWWLRRCTTASDLSSGAQFWSCSLEASRLFGVRPVVFYALSSASASVSHSASLFLDPARCSSSSRDTQTEAWGGAWRSSTSSTSVFPFWPFFAPLEQHRAHFLIGCLCLTLVLALSDKTLLQGV